MMTYAAGVAIIPSEGLNFPSYLRFNRMDHSPESASLDVYLHVHARTLTLQIDARTLPICFERLSRQILEIDEVTTIASLSTGTSSTTEK
jgi:hypothetical protein